MSSDQQRASRRLQALVPAACLGQEGKGAFATIKKAPLDPILGTNIMFQQDKDPQKVNVGVGAYRTDEGKPYILNVVKKAEKIVLANKQLNKEYLPIAGLPAFRTLARGVIFGKDSPAIRDQRVVTVQALSGTGALRVGAEFIAKFMPGRTVYISSPTWGNHISIFQNARVPIAYYKYWDAKKRGLDFDGMINDLKKAPKGSIILLHACAHNPTGVDPTLDQWKAISRVMKERGHFPFFDSAYQGFASGSLDRDAAAIRYFVAQGFELFVAQSCAKNFGLYGERIGSFNIVCVSKPIADNVMSQLELIIRAMYSNPPMHGAHIVATILNSPELYKEWERELLVMSGRIKKMRQLLYNKLKELETPGDWSHIVSQIGMFSYTGLNPAQCERMIKKHHIYMLKNGRISMAGVLSKNAEYIANAIHEVVTNTQ